MLKWLLLSCLCEKCSDFWRQLIKTTMQFYRVKIARKKERLICQKKKKEKTPLKTCITIPIHTCCILQHIKYYLNNNNSLNNVNVNSDSFLIENKEIKSTCNIMVCLKKVQKKVRIYFSCRSIISFVLCVETRNWGENIFFALINKCF